jgi:hypothetical protein
MSSRGVWIAGSYQSDYARNFRRAHIADVTELDGIETHDCFSMSEYMTFATLNIGGSLTTAVSFVVTRED